MMKMETQVRIEYDETEKAIQAASGDDAESVANIIVGMRCEVQPGGRRGRVAFVGEVQQLNGGHWVGVIFDEPVGKTDGTTPDGTRYFDAPGEELRRVCEREKCGSRRLS
jgi:tubulin-folding cofactor B